MNKETQIISLLEETLSSKGVSGQTAIYIAITNEDLLSMNKLAINNGNKDDFGHTPLYRTAAAGNTNVIQLLVEEWESPMDIVNQAGQSAFTIAVSLGLGNFIDFLRGQMPAESIRKKTAEQRKRNEVKRAMIAFKSKPMKADEVVLQQFAAAQM